MRGGGWARAAGAAVLAGILGLALLLSVLPSGADSAQGSVFSVEDDGRRAAFLLLQELGHDVEAWTRAPGHLPRGEHLLFLGDVPEEPPGYEPEAEGERAGSSRRLRDPQHYLRFMLEGGTLVTTFDEVRGTFLVERLGFSGLRGVARVVDEPLERPEGEHRRLRFGTGEEVAVDGSEAWLRIADSGLEPLATDDQGRPVIASLPVRRGRLVVCAGMRLFLNSRIEDADHALLLVRLVEALDSPGRILFDEYSLGGWVPASPLELALAPGVWGFTAHLALLFGLFVWSIAWVGRFPRDPEPVEQLSALDRAGGMAGWIASRGRWDLLAAMLRRGVLRRLAERSGIALETERSSSSPSEPDRATVDRVLRPWAGRLGSEQERTRAAELFAPEATPVNASDDLERLGEELSRLEELVLASPTRNRTHG